MRRHARGENRNVVAPLEHAENAALRVIFGHLDDVLGDRLEVFDLQAKVSHGVLGMGVEPGTDQDEFGLDQVGQFVQAGPERRAVLSLWSAMVQGDVQGVAQARAGTCFSPRSSSGIEREAMDRKEANVLALVKNVLGAVAMVHVKIDDEHAVEPELINGFLGRQATLAKMQNPIPSPRKA